MRSVCISVRGGVVGDSFERVNSFCCMLLCGRELGELRRMEHNRSSTQLPGRALNVRQAQIGTTLTAPLRLVPQVVKSYLFAPTPRPKERQVKVWSREMRLGNWLHYAAPSMYW